MFAANSRRFLAQPRPWPRGRSVWHVRACRARGSVVLIVSRCWSTDATARRACRHCCSLPRSWPRALVAESRIDRSDRRARYFPAAAHRRCGRRRSRVAVTQRACRQFASSTLFLVSGCCAIAKGVSLWPLSASLHIILCSPGRPIGRRSRADCDFAAKPVPTGRRARRAMLAIPIPRRSAKRRRRGMHPALTPPCSRRPFNLSLIFALPY